MNEHVNMAHFIAPKSDQLNSDDLIGGPRTITVTRVTGNEGNAEQPVNIYYAEDEAHPFRPCKSMRRVMVKVWGANAAEYAGRSMTLYRDPKVKWGGMEVGGIRISHMTGLDKPETMALTETRSARKPYTVQPLKAPAPATTKARQTPEEWADGQVFLLESAKDIATFDRIVASGEKAMDKLKEQRADLFDRVCDAQFKARQRVQAAPEANDDDPFASDAEAAE